MLKEFTENAAAKAKEEISISQGLIVLIAVASFIVGLVAGILCASGTKRSKIKKYSFNADDYVKDLSFEDDDDDDREGFEYSF